MFCHLLDLVLDKTSDMFCRCDFSSFMLPTFCSKQCMYVCMVVMELIKRKRASYIALQREHSVNNIC